jgi:DNA-binding MarR family transcriptional regulator
VKSLHNEPGARSVGDGLGRLFELAVLLTEAMDRTLSGHGLTTARAEVIWALDRGGPMTQRELSEILRCTPRNVTGLLDALEAAGFVERGSHPTDRRATLVTLTARGTEMAAAWREEHERFAELLLGDAPDLDGFLGGLDHVLDRLRTFAAGSGT